jgi:group I intron endonuclease
MKTSSLNKKHRRVWYDHFGEIPRDENGISYEIHHINGDHNDNRIENLICVSISEHYDIHYQQGDSYACEAILNRVGEYLQNKPRVILSGEDHPMYGKKHTDESRRKISKNHADFSGEKNPMYGKKHSPESIDKMSKAKLGKSSNKWLKEAREKNSKHLKERWKSGKMKPKQSKRVYIDGQEFDSAKDAAKQLSVSVSLIRKKIKNEKFTDCYYI